MKVLYDHQIYSSQVYGGVSRYFCELINCFFNNEEIIPLIDVWFSNNSYINNSPEIFSYHFLKNFNFNGKNRILEWINRIHSISLIKKNNFDLFHPTFYNPYFLKYLDNKPFVLTVHDLIHEIYPQLPNAEKEVSAKKQLIEKATRIITPSANTKNDLLKFYHLDPDKVSVIPHGFFELKNDTENEFKLPAKYFLFVGSRVFYKNFTQLLEAFAEIKKEYSDIKLICVGGGEFSKLETELISSLNLHNLVCQYSFSDNQLKTAYSKAIAFIFPSLYEGFGIPILEAFSNNCPCILANSSCFPEVAGDAALYFKPDNTDDLKEKMSDILSNEKLRKELIEKGKNRLKNFSWEKTADKTIEVYKQAINTYGAK
jgi:glycosyltransferase involved in cell wall biosynthesis